MNDENLFNVIINNTQKNKDFEKDSQEIEVIKN